MLALLFATQNSIRNSELAYLYIVYTGFEIFLSSLFVILVLDSLFVEKQLIQQNYLYILKFKYTSIHPLYSIINLEIWQRQVQMQMMKSSLFTTY